MLGEIEEFLTGQRSGPPSDRVLATLLFTDIVTSTETAARLGDRDWNALLETHRDVVRSELKRFGGREVGTTGDGFLAMFDGPARAVRCGLAIVDRLAGLGIQIRAGVHTSEVVVSGNDVAGLGVHVAARIMALAKPGEVLVSSVVATPPWVRPRLRRSRPAHAERRRRRVVAPRRYPGRRAAWVAAAPLRI
ncbi:MAG: adenylate/guanylate cyclase domain-containing protein [Acidimicrobiia bacterium]|nr:adenylate/guanylate cyclase domain-containing protein [Acidimicrobiia bacterium]